MREYVIALVKYLLQLGLDSKTLKISPLLPIYRNSSCIVVFVWSRKWVIGANIDMVQFKGACQGQQTVFFT